VGLKLEIKPHINVNNVVMLEITQELSQPNPNPPGNVDNLAGQLISRKREIEASVAVSSGNTIVLGGQVREDNNRDRSKVPFLGDIPLLGRLFTYNARSKNRTETVVFMTPYVLDSPEKIEEESRRRRDALDVGGMWKQGWSNSRLRTVGSPSLPKNRASGGPSAAMRRRRRRPHRSVWSPRQHLSMRPASRCRVNSTIFCRNRRSAGVKLSGAAASAHSRNSGGEYD